MKLLVLSCLALALLAARSMADDKVAQTTSDTRVFELRTYTAAPGKMKDLHARFRDHTCKLLEKHGMTLIGFWVPVDPKGAEETLIYVVAHASQEAAKKSWAAFGQDEDWKKAKAESEKNGPLLAKPPEARFFNPTDYSVIR